MNTARITATGGPLGINGYLNRLIKASLNFEHTTFAGGGASLRRPDENALLSRVQVRY